MTNNILIFRIYTKASIFRKKIRFTLFNFSSSLVLVQLEFYYHHDKLISCLESFFTSGLYQILMSVHGRHDFSHRPANLSFEFQLFKVQRWSNSRDEHGFNTYSLAPRMIFYLVETRWQIERARLRYVKNVSTMAH